MAIDGSKFKAVNNRDRNFTRATVKRLPKVAGEMALHVLAYNLTRVLNILGIQPLPTGLRA